MILRHINGFQRAETYARRGWRLTWYGWRGDDLPCWCAGFRWRDGWRHPIGWLMAVQHCCMAAWREWRRS